jgi:hypothetical protein
MPIPLRSGERIPACRLSRCLGSRISLLSRLFRTEQNPPTSPCFTQQKERLLPLFADGSSRCLSRCRRWRHPCPFLARFLPCADAAASLPGRRLPSSGPAVGPPPNVEYRPRKFAFEQTSRFVTSGPSRKARLRFAGASPEGRQRLSRGDEPQNRALPPPIIVLPNIS